MKLKILSDGTPRNTRVIDEETGESLDGVISIEWSMVPSKEARLWLQMENIPVELVGDQILPYELHNDPPDLGVDMPIGYDPVGTGANPADVLADLWREAGYEIDEDSLKAAHDELGDLTEEQLRRIVKIFMRQTRRKLSDVTDEQREQLADHVPEMPTHRRES